MSKQPSRLIQTLDHVAVVSDRAGTLFSSYERLGFQLTPVTQHFGAIKPGEQPVKWGTGNRCAMFKSGYLELLAILDGDLFCRGFPERIARYEGLHIIALGCADAQATESALISNGAGVQGIGRLERMIGTPDGEGLAKFSLVRLQPDEAPECHLNILQHHTPELLWQDRYLDHPNGAISLDAVTLCVEDPDAVAARYARFLDCTPVADGTRRRFEFPRGRLDLMSAEDLRAQTGFKAPVLPFVATFTVGSESLSKTRAWLQNNDVAFSEQNDGLYTDPEAGCGAICIFR